MVILFGQSVSIGKAVIKAGRPSLIVSVFDEDGDSLLKRFSPGQGKEGLLYELRYDLFTKKSPEAVKKTVTKLTEMGVDFVFTYRTRDVNEALEYYGAALEAGCVAVDLDYELLGSGLKIPPGVTTIASVHVFDKAPIGQILEKLQSTRAGLVKIAVRYEESDTFVTDLANIIKFKAKTGRPLAFIPMGRGAEFLRLVAACLVSDLNYVHDGKPTAEGQPELDKFRSEIERFCIRN